jgi:predicted nucleic acid-binding protein
MYMDVCCLNRPFDDQTIRRNRLESEAILNILSYFKIEVWVLVSSEAVILEASKCSDIERKQKVFEFVELAKEKINVSEITEKRAKELQKIGFDPLDALHIACAEEAKVDVFLTTDDDILKRAKREFEKIQVVIRNPLNWLMEAE